MCIRNGIIAIAIGFFLGSLTAEETQAQVRKYSNEFLKIGVGARALGMSNAYISSVQDVTAGYWNPAGLTNIQSDLQLGAMHSEYFAGIAKYDYGAIAKPIDSVSTIGFSLIRFGVDDIPNTTRLIDGQGNVNYNRVTSFSAADYAGLISYARKLDVPGLTVGGNIKIIHRIVGNMASAWGFGLDASANYRYQGWRLSAVARDVTSTYNAWSFSLDERTKEVFELTGNTIPKNSLEITLPTLILGMARSFPIGKNFSILAEGNMEFTFDGKRNTWYRGDPISAAPRVGIETSYKGIVHLRAGVGNFQRVKEDRYSEKMIYQPNMGVGVTLFDRLTLDYALTDIGDQSVALFSNVFSLKYDIYKDDG